MEENTEVLEHEDTTPNAEMQDGAGETAPEETAPATDGESGADTTPPEGTAGEGAQPQEEKFLLHYNHQPVEITQKEAQNYCQRWMHLSREGGLLDKINDLADRRGMEAEELIDGLIKAVNDSAMAECLEKAGGNQEIAQILYDKQMDGYKTAHLAANESRKAKADTDAGEVTERLAEEFAAMQSDFGLSDFGQVPKSVIDTAIGEGIHLRDAYLRYQWAESKRAEQNKKQQNAAQRATTGSQQGETMPNAENSIIAAMMQGVRG